VVDQRSNIHVGRSEKQSRRPKLHARNPSAIMGTLNEFLSPPPIPVDIIRLEAFEASG